MYTVSQEKIQFDKIEKLEAGYTKYLKLCVYMFNVVPYSYFWCKAKEESERLERLGFGF